MEHLVGGGNSDEDIGNVFGSVGNDDDGNDDAGNTDGIHPKYLRNEYL